MRQSKQPIGSPQRRELGAVHRESDNKTHPALLRVPQAMARLSLSRTVIYELIRSGRLRSVKQGRTRLIPENAIGEYIGLLERETWAA